jgi:hypothetical protein
MTARTRVTGGSADGELAALRIFLPVHRTLRIDVGALAHAISARSQPCRGGPDFNHCPDGVPARGMPSGR